jgi:GNAT superfamily N-acetyltransferase
MAITVRKAAKEDAPTIARLAISLFDLHVGWDPKRFTHVATAEGAAWYYGQRAEDGRVVVAEADGAVVGFAYFEYEERDYVNLLSNAVWLHDIYVDESQRGKGAGRALLEAVSTEAKQLGAAKVVLTVAAENETGQALFTRNGFRTTMHEMMLVIDDNNG